MSFETSSWASIAIGCVIVLITVILVLYYGNLARIRSKMNMNGVEGGFPIVGHALDMLSDSPWDIMNKWSEKYGSIYRFNLFGNDCVVICDPEMLRTVLQTQVKIFKKDIEFTYHPFLDILGTGIVTSDGSSWIKQRTLITAPLRFHILDYIPDIAKRATFNLMHKLEAISGDPNGRIDLSDEFRLLALSVICEALLSLTDPVQCQTFADLYLPIVIEDNLRTWYKWRESPIFGPITCPLAYYQHAQRVGQLNEFVSNIIKARWEEKCREKDEPSAVVRRQDVLDKMLDGLIANSTDRILNIATLTQLRDEIKTFVLAGHETTASMLTWTMAEVLKDESILSQLKAESDAVYGINSTDLTLDEFAALKVPDKADLDDKLLITSSCLRESLRKYSVVPTVVRVVDCPDAKGYLLTSPSGKNHFLPNGTTVMVAIRAVHYFCHDKPNEFNPTRFINPPINNYTFLPFIEGPRSCLGQFLSILEAKTVVSLLVKFFYGRLALVEGQEIVPHKFNVPIVPRDGVWVYVKKTKKN